MEIRLTPNGSLRLQSRGRVPESAALATTRAAFQVDWCEGLFCLAAEKISLADLPTASYWQTLAGRFLTGLCHVPKGMVDWEVQVPSQDEFRGMVMTAPPMVGAEYLSVDVLQTIWNALAVWARATSEKAGGVETFLQDRAPRWRQVGQVCFHLAENKNNTSLPFAFMATYATGFGADGQLKYLPLRKALEQYAGARNRPALIKLLFPVQQAADACSWVKGLVDSGRIYHPMGWSAEQAYQFLRSAAQLEESGLSVRMPNWWKKHPRPRVSVTIGEQKSATLGVDAMLDFDVNVALGDAALSAKELAALLAGDDGLVLFKGQWIEVDRGRLQEAIAHWEALGKDVKHGEISFIEGMRLLAGASKDLKHEEDLEKDRAWVHVNAGDAMRRMIAGLREPDHLPPVDAGDGLRTELRPYQQTGVAWLRFLTELGLGACLADDMGLGKTIQVLALLLCFRRAGKLKPGAASLLIVPASLLGNWRNEATRFAPGLNLLFLHPAESDRRTLAAIARSPATYLSDVDLVVTTYAMVGRQAWLAERDWRLVILDEAQAVKNHATAQSRSVRKLRARARIALTGTPVENRLGDLWALFDFLNPGLLGSARVFTSFVKTLQARPQDQFAPLRRLVGPYLLRRLKTDPTIIADLPEKTEMPRYCALTQQQVRLYEKTVRALQQALETADGMARRGLVLQTLMRLKQICNHPSQLTGDGDYNPDHSGKFKQLADICEELAQRQEKVLIFTQFREIIPPLADHLALIFGRDGAVLHGGTGVKQRKGIVARFQEEDGPPFFILSLKAGGTGLNLTMAAHVIHFDRWWNPAVENQATDRVFRIGQKRNVLVHKFITRGTVEERIDRLIAEKQKLADELLTGAGEVNLTELSDDELMNMVRLDVTRAEG